ncbi:MAG: hypothetical protein ABFC63_01975 [Thermoguttaceae bacterium]
MSRAWSLILLVACCLTPCQRAASATPKVQIEESRPSVYYLPDKNGNLQAVLGFDYADFLELYHLKNQLGRPDQPSRFRIERIVATGAASAAHAELQVRVQVVLRDDGWVCVPLRLDQGLLRGIANYDGPGEHSIDSDPERGGYVSWIRGAPGSRHVVTLTLLVPLETSGDETRLNLRFPKTAAGEMTLSTPLAKALATVTPGATLLESPAKPAGKTPPGQAATTFHVVGLPTDFQIAWRKPRPPGEEPPPVLDASGTVLARLDGRGATTDVTLTVRSLTTPFDRFTVRLPVGAKRLPGPRDEPDVAIVPAPDRGAAAAEDARQPLVEVRLRKPTAGPVDVRLRCRREWNLADGDAWRELAGFEVVDAARQGGTIAVAAADDWQVLFGVGRQIRSLDASPDVRQTENLVARFEYFGQPYSLPVRLAARSARLSVEPRYVLFVDRDQVRLEATLAYRIHRAKLSTLEVALPGWVLDDAGPHPLVRSDGPALGLDQHTTTTNDATADSYNVAIPLARPVSGPVELHLRAHRAIPNGATSLAVPLPRPKADTVAAASLIVVPSDNVELIPDRRSIDGLEPAPMPAVTLPLREQTPLCYRAAGRTSLFGATLRILPPRIDADAAVGAILVDRAWIQSWFTASAREDRAVFQLTTDRGSLHVWLPADADATQADVLADGHAVEPRLAADNRLIVPLAATSRRHVVEIRYHLPARRSRPASLLSLELPRLEENAWMRRVYWQLVLPPNEHLIGNPDGLTGEFAWRWQGCFCGRNPLLDEVQLESWADAVPSDRLPERANRYLFSAIGRLDRVDVRTASRTWIVLVASGVALVVGLLFIRVSALRRPVCLCVLAIGLGAAASIAPEPTLLLAQAASLGLLLTLLAALLERAVAGRGRRTAARELARSRTEFGSSRASATTSPENPPSTALLSPTPPSSPGETVE